VVGGGSEWQAGSRAGDLMGWRAGRGAWRAVVGGVGLVWARRVWQAGGRPEASKHPCGWAGGWVVGGAGGRAGWRTGGRADGRAGGRAGGLMPDGLMACVLSLVWWP
jgi:hypothetical protein